jgi:hypothetical protein
MDLHSLAAVTLPQRSWNLTHPKMHSCDFVNEAIQLEGGRQDVRKVTPWLPVTGGDELPLISPLVLGNNSETV